MVLFRITMGGSKWRARWEKDRHLKYTSQRPKEWQMTDQSHRILVVDDDQEMCGMLSDVLKGEGFSVLTTNESLEASKILKREEFDVIITDLKMKGLKGLELLEETRQVSPLT